MWQGAPVPQDPRFVQPLPQGSQRQDEIWAEVGWDPSEAKPWQSIFALPPGYDDYVGPTWVLQERQVARNCWRWREGGFPAREAEA